MFGVPAEDAYLRVMVDKVRLAVFASGNGSNAENIIRYFQARPESGMEVALVVCNRREALVLQRASTLGVPAHVVPAPGLRDREVMMPLLERFRIGAIVLAGFLQIVPEFITARYAGRILNIHPSLLPKYGGKGMYGRHVHEAVVAAGDTETGITVHRVTEWYDEGAIVFQAKMPVEPDDTPDTVERRIHELERMHYPRVIADTFGRLTPLR